MSKEQKQTTHRYPRPDQPPEIVRDKLLHVWRPDMSGEHARSRFDSVALGTLTAIFYQIQFLLCKKQDFIEIAQKHKFSKKSLKAPSL